MVTCLLSLHPDPSDTEIEMPNSFRIRLQELSNKLKALRSIVENTVTLNTGGHFEWVDSKIVKSLKYGQFICLEHVNLCSSAVLDRLNSVFEPNGSLLISEKGVSVDNEPDVVTKHENFCAVLTLDPKNGEISRAMRNRCIEINVNKESYSSDDLKRLIYVNGVKDTCLIDCLLKIHKRVAAVSDFNAFEVSHILKCSFLIAENKRQGCSDIDALKASTIEVYVRSSNTDLLGFGLDFYRNKLETEIMEEMGTMSAIANVINYDNIILKTSELGTLSLIQWQCEVFLTLARCHQQQIDTNDILPNEFSDFAHLPMEASLEKLCYMLLVIYDISSYGDVEHRKTYLELSLAAIFGSDSAVVKALLRLNNELYQSIADSQSIKTLQKKNVPWNSKIFPRLRNYKNEKLSTSDQLKVTAELITKTLSKDVTTKDSIKLNQIDVLTYSKAVQAKSLQDSLRNDVVSFVYPLLTSIPEFIQNSLHKSSDVTYEMFSQLICSFMWTDRMQRMSHSQLFKNKKLNENMLDKLILHFGWLQKHLITPLKQSTSDTTTASSTAFDKSFGKMLTHIQSNCHPLNQVRKEYVKKFTNFMPYYDEHQVLLHESVREFNNLTSLVAHLGRFEKDDIIRKIKIIFNENTTEMKKFLTDCSSDGLDWLNVDAIAIDENADSSTELTEIIREKKKTFFENVNDSTEIDSLALRKLNDFLPVAEYFAMKSLTPVMLNQTSKHSVNVEFFNRINTINIDLLQQVKAIKNDKFKECETNWIELIRQLKEAYNSQDESDLPSIMSAFTTNFYKNYSSFNRKMISQLRSFSMNSICVQNDLLYNAELGAPAERYSYDGPTLTITILNALLDGHGHFKLTGLGEAAIWRGTLSLLSKVIWYNMNICSSSSFSVV